MWGKHYAVELPSGVHAGSLIGYWVFAVGIAVLRGPPALAADAGSAGEFTMSHPRGHSGTAT